jgi:hypothetical protein
MLLDFIVNLNLCFYTLGNTLLRFYTVGWNAGFLKVLYFS